jgi:hypothetical protein
MRFGARVFLLVSYHPEFDVAYMGYRLGALPRFLHGKKGRRVLGHGPRVRISGKQQSLGAGSYIAPGSTGLPAKFMLALWSKGCTVARKIGA